MSSKIQGPWISLLGLLSLLVLAAVACTSAKAQSGAKAAIHLKNFEIGVASTLPAGLTTFDISSVGPTMHELNIARTDMSSGKLPVSADGTVDDLTPHAGFDHLAEAEGIDIGEHKTLTVNLTPGHYSLYCNMEGHYMAGMHTDFTVQ